MIARFGDHWRAKTTEEIVEDREFLAAYDPDSAATLLKLLRRADFEKFADQRVTDQGDMIAVLESWEALVRDVFEAGARSTIKGK